MKTLITLTAICAAFVCPAIAGPDGDGKGKKGKRPGGAPDGKRPSPEQIIQKLDTDGNGTISLAEFKAGPMAQRAKDPAMLEKRFQMMDESGDGNVTKEEFTAAMKKMRERGGRPGGKPDGDGKRKKGKPDTAA